MTHDNWTDSGSIQILKKSTAVNSGVTILMGKTKGAKGRGCNSKNGAVAENPSVRSNPSSPKCPKCGNEMVWMYMMKEPHWYCGWCGHEEKVQGGKK
jgi:ribosomal protein S27AE